MSTITTDNATRNGAEQLRQLPVRVQGAHELSRLCDFAKALQENVRESKKHLLFLDPRTGNPLEDPTAVKFEGYLSTVIEEAS